MSLNWHIAYIFRGMYPFTPSLTHLLVGQEDKGQELPPGALDCSKGHSWSRQVPTSFLHEQACRPGLGRGITGCFPRVFLLICRNCCAGCDLLWVPVLCNPYGTISTILHLSKALGKAPVQGEIQHVQLASNFSLLQLSTPSYVWNFCRKSIIIQFERCFDFTSNWFSSSKCFGFPPIFSNCNNFIQQNIFNRIL